MPMLRGRRDHRSDDRDDGSEVRGCQLSENVLRKDIPDIPVRGAAMILLKAVGVDPVPNYTRDIKQGIARWDAYLHVPDPDALAVEFASRNVEFFQPLTDNDDGSRGCEVKDADGYMLFFGRPRSAAFNCGEPLCRRTCHETPLVLCRLPGVLGTRPSGRRSGVRNVDNG
ncbi:MAG TPA: hypothetical protein VI485_32275 [Vicinamibacterales bacterium]|nr:hypothetical protein [Vicinamibacterales bacterium]